MQKEEIFESSISDRTVLYAILAFLWIETLWELYLAARQYSKCLKTEEVPAELESVMTKETFNKARLYSLDKSKFNFIHDIFSLSVTTMMIYCGVLAKLWSYSESINPWEGEVLISCIWIFLFTTISTIIDLPFTIFYTFVLEEKYGFNKQTPKFFVVDKIKWFIFQQAISLPLSSLTIVIIKYGGPFFFVWLWLVVGVIALLMITIYPAFIAPLFDKYTPLPEGELRADIETLASDLKFPLTQLYVVEGSKRSSHSNAYFYGLFKSKRIVLFDTLLQNDDSGCKNDEILAVLSHELGHWSHGHIIKNLVIMQLHLLFVFVFFSFMFQFSPVYQALGFPAGCQPVLVGLMVISTYVMTPYNSLLSFIMTCLSRHFEFQADEFAAKLKKAEPLQRALIKLNKDNLGFPVYDDLYSSWHHSHPPLLERMKALKKFE
ncbi:CAAX prenyl protease 1 homolog [Onthophagus taurus]|uniref:CAAX prenyl protease 1 homolog n=1 Tax=Onthophagus taurus TaxID=166361 RepID=UPI000C208D99|nr:CAAX prenyl protease 1 homolog [Onthophagus taurus]